MSWPTLVNQAVRGAITLPDVCPEDSEFGAWHIAPWQHVVESSVIISASAWGVWHWSRAFRAELRAHRAADRAEGVRPRQQGPPSAWLRVVDALLRGLLVLSYLTVVWHKWNGGTGHGAKLPYLLQPCHLLHVLMMYIACLPRGSDQGAVLLAIYLHELCAPFLGMVAADRSCYTQRFELANWGLQHALLLLAPLYLLVTQRFGTRVHGGGALFGLSMAALVLLHWLVLAPVSALTGTNINYTLCPPAGQGLLLRFGLWYRWPMIGVCAFLSWALRYGVVEAFLRALGLATPQDPHTLAVAAKAANGKVTPQADTPEPATLQAQEKGKDKTSKQDSASTSSNGHEQHVKSSTQQNHQLRQRSKRAE